jgi:hypothetical protein
MVRFYKNEFDKMLCKLDSAKYARAFQQNPTLLAGFSETNVRIQWNPVYKVFYRICCCGNETNR